MMLLLLVPILEIHFVEKKLCERILLILMASVMALAANLGKLGPLYETNDEQSRR